MATSERVRFPRWLLVSIGIVGLGLAIYALRGVLTPIFFAFLIAYLLDPLVDRFEARGLPRALGIVVLLALTLGAMVVGALVLVPMVVREVVAFAHELPEKLEGLRRAAEPLLTSYGIPVPHSFEDLRQLVETGSDAGEIAPTDLAGRAATVMGTAAGWIWGRTASVLAVITSLLIVPVIAFYLLHDFDEMTAGIRDLVPLRYRPFVVDVATEVDQVLGQFIRGQLLVMLALAVLYSVAYSLVGVRLAIPIGIVAGLISFIPYVGGATALILALLMCLLSWQGWGQIVGVVVAYAIIQVLEGFVITPRIVGDKVGLPAIWVLIALMVGGELFGFLGVLLSVPAAAVAKIFVMRLLAWYRKSQVYLHPSAVVTGVLGEEGLPDSAEMASAKAAASVVVVGRGEDLPAESEDGSGAGTGTGTGTGTESGPGTGPGTGTGSGSGTGAGTGAGAGTGTGTGSGTGSGAEAAAAADAEAEAEAEADAAADAEADAEAVAEADADADAEAAAEADADAEAAAAAEAEAEAGDLARPGAAASGSATLSEPLRHRSGPESSEDESE
ncbi:MAG: hypothetical protein SangKO_064190 [Sandaracinaceae bacterium]